MSHVRRRSETRIPSLPPSPVHHIPTSPSTHRRVSTTAPFKLSSPSFRSRSHRRSLSLLLAALSLVMGCMVVFNLLSAGDSELLQVSHAAGEAERAGRVVPGVQQQDQLQRPANAQDEQEKKGEQHKWEVVQLEQEHGAREIVEEAEEDSKRVDGAGSQQAAELQQAEPVAVKEEDRTAVSTDTSLPVCKRTMLFKMAGLHGFGSEFNLLIRAASLARRFDYTLLPVDSSSWNYGDVSSFFTTPALTCRPPRDTTRRTPMTFDDEDVDGADDDGSSGVNLPWTRNDHVVWSHRNLDGLDRAIVGLFTKEEEVGELHRWDLEKLSLAHQRKEKQEGHAELLPADQTVPEAYLEVFKHQSQLAKSLWRPTEEIVEMANKVQRELKLSATESEKRQAGDLTIGMHVRLGDKYMEASHIGPQAYAKDLVPEPIVTSTPGLHSDALVSYLTAATELVSSILTTSLDHVSSAASPSAWKGKPTLVIMSDNGDAWKSFADHKLGKRFRVVGTPVAKLEGNFELAKAEAKGKKMVKKTKKLIKRQDEKGVDPLAKDGGFNEISFNSMALSARVALTKTFVRDVSLLAEHADGLVLTASSNVGRLLLLLAGEEKVLESRVRSLDTRWFPTSQFY